MATLTPVSPNTKALKLDKIAVFTDFTQNSELAVQYAAKLARSHDAELVLAHAYIPPYAAFAAPETSLVYEAFADLEKSLQDRLETLAKSDALRDLSCAVCAHEGVPKDLLECIGDPDLIVVGTSGDTGMPKAAFGSTAETIFRCSRVPVVTVGPRCVPEVCKNPELKTILYATDFSPGASAALSYALWIAARNHANLILLHVSPSEDARFSYEREMSSIEPLEKLRAMYSDSLSDPNSEAAKMHEKLAFAVCFGKPEEVIAEEARNRHADLIVIGANGAGAMSGIRSHFGGGTAYHVAANAHCPVLTIRTH